MIAALAADPQFGDIKVVAGIGEANISRPGIFWNAQNYHDLHNLLTVDPRHDRPIHGALPKIEITTTWK